MQGLKNTIKLKIGVKSQIILELVQIQSFLIILNRNLYLNLENRKYV